jgi:hypothetical protein
MCSVNTQSTWVYGKAYDFWITKGPSVYSKMKWCIVVVASDSTKVTIMMQCALYIDSLRSRREVQVISMKGGDRRGEC